LENVKKPGEGGLSQLRHARFSSTLKMEAMYSSETSIEFFIVIEEKTSDPALLVLYL
jgi:hypothetical protein